MADHGSHTAPGDEHFPIIFIMTMLAAFVFFTSRLVGNKQADSIPANQPKNVIPTSAKPRDSIIFYVAQPGDSIESVSKGFNISTETIRRSNNLSETDEIEPGIKLTILPVNGYAHTVEQGETIYTIARKHNVDPMNIVNYPFNTFKNPDTFELETGQMLIVPE